MACVPIRSRQCPASPRDPRSRLPVPSSQDWRSTWSYTDGASRPYRTDDGCRLHAASRPPPSCSSPSGLLQDELVPVGVMEDRLGRGIGLALGWPFELHALGHEFLVVGLDVARSQHEPLEGASGHGVEPGDQRQRRAASLGLHLNPVETRNSVIVAHEFEPELVNVERYGALLVGYGNGNDDHVLQCHFFVLLAQAGGVVPTSPRYATASVARFSRLATFRVGGVQQTSILGRCTGQRS